MIKHRTLRALALIGLGLGLLPDSAAAANGEYCKRYQAGDQVVLVLIDRTSPMRPNAQQAVRDAIAAALVSTKPGMRLDIAAISDSMVNRRTLYGDCRPGRGVRPWERPLDAVEVSHFTQQFESQVQAVVDAELKLKTTTKSSALVDSIVNFSKLYPDGAIKHLILASDMLDNVQFGLPKASLTSFNRQQAIQAATESQRIAKLKDAAVRTYGFGVDDEQGKKLDDSLRNDIEALWKEYFRRSGATFLTILGH